jgi:pimeloyl-ACP methyl ester carboxylesterase
MTDTRFQGHQAVVVAHSMGGLIARWAVTDAPGAPARKGRTGLVITLGTPYEGSWAAGIGSALTNANGPAVTTATAPLLDLVHLALVACRRDPARASDACVWFTKAIEFLASMHAFAPGSVELKSLSPWPNGMRIRTLTSSAVVQDVGGLFLFRGPGTVDLGDVVVGRASAISGGHPAKVVECSFTTAKWTADMNGLLERFGMRLDSDTAKLIGLRLLGACFHIHESVLLDHATEVLGAVAEELQRYDPLAKLVGTWRVHGSSVVIKGNGTGTEVWNMGPCNNGRMCAAHAKLQFTVVPGGVKATYADIEFRDDTGKPPFDVGTEGKRVGQSYLITYVRPGLLKRQALGDLEPFSNPYLCGKGISAADERECGA